MKHHLSATALATLLVMGLAAPAWAEVPVPGAHIGSLLALAKERNPEYAGMRHEAQAALERVAPAGALMDPKFRVELMDITKMGSQSPTLWPGDVGSTQYTLMQDIPWPGKRDLKRDLAESEAVGSEGRAQGTWSELAARIKTTQAQRHYLRGNAALTQEILDLMTRLEQVAQSRYANGLAAQQDVIRSQLEQTAMRNELVMIESERSQADARLNALLARPALAPLAAPETLRALPAPAQLDHAKLAQRVRAGNPQLFVEEARIQAAEKNRELTLKNRYPDFTLSLSPTQQQSRIREWSLMLEVNIPLQQASRRAMEREAEAMLLAAQSRKQAAANAVLAELAQQLAGLEAARRTETLATGSLLPQANLTLSSAMASYENGKLDFATLLDAQRQIRQARQSQLKAQLEGQMRLAEIEKLLGEDV